MNAFSATLQRTACRAFPGLRRNKAVDLRDPEAGLTVQDAMFNGIITLIAIVAAVVVFFVVRNMFTGSNAVTEITALINGVRSSNGGNANYSGITAQGLINAGALPSDTTATSSGGSGSVTLTAPWSPRNITLTGTSNYFQLSFTPNSTSDCVQIVNGVLAGVDYMQVSSSAATSQLTSSTYGGGTALTTSSAAAACVAGSDIITIQAH